MNEYFLFHCYFPKINSNNNTHQILSIWKEFNGSFSIDFQTRAKMKMSKVDQRATELQPLRLLNSVPQVMTMTWHGLARLNTQRFWIRPWGRLYFYLFNVSLFINFRSNFNDNWFSYTVALFGAYINRNGAPSCSLWKRFSS